MKWEEIDTEDFLRLSHDICENDQEKYSLLYGLSLGITEFGSHRLLKFKDKAIALQTSPQKPLIVSDLNPAMAKSLAAYIENKNDITEIIGTKGSAQLVIDNLRSTHPELPEMLMSQKIYSLKNLNLPKIENKIIKATDVHIELVARWFHDFMIDTYVNLAPKPEHMKTLAQTRIAKGDVYLLIKDGTPASMACTTRPTKKSVSINGVFTPIERRGEGLASETVALLCEKMLKKYETCSLYTDSTNPTSNKIYSKIGFVEVCESLHYRVNLA